MRSREPSSFCSIPERAKDSGASGATQRGGGERENENGRHKSVCMVDGTEARGRKISLTFDFEGPTTLTLLRRGFTVYAPNRDPDPSP